MIHGDQDIGTFLADGACQSHQLFPVLVIAGKQDNSARQRVTDSPDIFLQKTQTDHIEHNGTVTVSFAAQ